MGGKNKKGSYDTEIVQDPMAKPSPTIKKAHISNSKHVYGDGDCWVEGVYHSTKFPGEYRIYFQSQKTGRKIVREPPTGASKVVYLRDSVRERRIRRM
mmetsp:Transcript_7523/g.11324  ORF Transcript_7523/g.11324 Transcript_7523/m.11324 type:complete len:98 (-) Transcript_7523:414-707(-)